MQDSGRDSKPGVGARNVTDDRIGAKRWLDQPDLVNRSAVVIDMAQLEHGVYRAIFEDLFAIAPGR
jgi:hypothetical protein